jgi:hypothetical protein
MCLAVRHPVSGTDVCTCVSGVVAHDYVTHHIVLNEAHGVSIIGPGVPLDAKKVHGIRGVVQFICKLRTTWRGQFTPCPSSPHPLRME